MLLGQTLQNISNTVLIYPFGLIMLAGMILSIKSGFIQIRAIKHMILTLWRSATKKEKEGSQTIAAHKALFIAMSTTIGIGNIVGPIIAIGLGGPGALAGFIVGTIFGSAVTFSEVFLAISYRKRRDDGSIAGGPMTYLSEVFGNAWAKFYAYAGFILLIAWSSNQSNTLAVLLASRGVSPYATGIILAITVTIVLIGGVKRIGNFSAKLVPAMFIIYCVAMFWILGCHIHQVPAALKLIFTSLWNPQSAIGATAGFGMAQAVRWGVARAVQINEIGTGTSTFPHSMAETNSPTDQGILSIAAVYTNGFLCLMSGLIILVTGAWQEPGAVFDITMFSKILATHFPHFGPQVLLICSFMFAFGTILGNSYNGSQCFLYTTKNRWINLYYLLSAVVVFLGCISEVRFVWTMVDFFVLPVALPHIAGVVVLAFRNRDMFSLKSLNQPNESQSNNEEGAA